jgi:hypothetical protein
MACRLIDARDARVFFAAVEETCRLLLVARPIIANGPTVSPTPGEAAVVQRRRTATSPLCRFAVAAARVRL